MPTYLSCHIRPSGSEFQIGLGTSIYSGPLHFIFLRIFQNWKSFTLHYLRSQPAMQSCQPSSQSKQLRDSYFGKSKPPKLIRVFTMSTIKTLLLPLYSRNSGNPIKPSKRITSKELGCNFGWVEGVFLIFIWGSSIRSGLIFTFWIANIICSAQIMLHAYSKIRWQRKQDEKVHVTEQEEGYGTIGEVEGVEELNEVKWGN